MCTASAILYHLLAGRPVFQAATVIETMRQVVEVDPRPPCAYRPNIDRDLETICLKCLNKNPRDRYPSAEALAEDLEHWLHGETILARPASSAEKFWRWCRRHPAIATLSATVLLLLVAVTLVSTVAAFRIRQARNETLRAAEGTEEKLYVASLAQARNARLAAQSGWRTEALDALNKAALIKRTPELRSEAMAALITPDARLAPTLPSSEHPATLLFPDIGRGRYFAVESNAVVARSLRDDRELLRIEEFPVRGHPESFREITPDGRWLAMRFDDKSVQVFTVALPRGEWNLGGVGRFAFGRIGVSPDSTRIVYSQVAHQLRIGWLTNLYVHIDVHIEHLLDHLAWSPTAERLAYTECAVQMCSSSIPSREPNCRVWR